MEAKIFCCAGQWWLSSANVELPEGQTATMCNHANIGKKDPEGSACNDLEHHVLNSTL